MKNKCIAWAEKYFHEFGKSMVEGDNDFLTHFALINECQDIIPALSEKPAVPHASVNPAETEKPAGSFLSTHLFVCVFREYPAAPGGDR